MRFFVAILALSLPAVALAQAPQTTPQAPAPAPSKHVMAFGADNPKCLEWTDDCVVCKRQPDDDFACSTPGTACVAVDPRCSKWRE